MRSFIRHPSDIPIDVSPDNNPEGSPEMLINISHGGLSFRSQASLLPGTIVDLRVNMPNRDTRVRARVVWSREADNGYDMGVEFMNSADLYTMRMVEQICHIEHYRRKVRLEQGRELDAEQAAMEWISKNASDFPNPD